MTSKNAFLLRPLLDKTSCIPPDCFLVISSNHKPVLMYIITEAIGVKEIAGIAYLYLIKKEEKKMLRFTYFQRRNAQQFFFTPCTQHILQSR